MKFPLLAVEEDNRILCVNHTADEVFCKTSEESLSVGFHALNSRVVIIAAITLLKLF